jgi:IS605 OrfB family transposase
MHKISRTVARFCKKYNISILVIGKNDGWKQDIKMNKKNKQNFVYIPYQSLISKIRYKCLELGTVVVCNEEAYTSKCSFLDMEPIYKHEVYKGKRVKRGLFVSSDGTKINADVNAAMNILRKHLGDGVITQVFPLHVQKITLKLDRQAVANVKRYKSKKFAFSNSGSAGLPQTKLTPITNTSQANPCVVAVLDKNSRSIMSVKFFVH